MSVAPLWAAGLAALTVRMLVSLAVVLGVIGVAYVIAKHRAVGARRTARQGGVASLIRGRLGRVDRGSARGAGPRALDVVGRVGLTRGSAAVALRFGDRVVLVAAGETGSATVLAEMSAAEWDEAHLVREPLEFPVQRAVAAHAAPDPTARPGLLEALRMATARRG